MGTKKENIKMLRKSNRKQPYVRISRGKMPLYTLIDLNKKVLLYLFFSLEIKEKLDHSSDAKQNSSGLHGLTSTKKQTTPTFSNLDIFSQWCGVNV